jgi:tetratricopeptide (TPR) repeat protein
LFFTSHQIETLLAEVSTTDRDRELNETLGGLIPQLSANKVEYRHFGPYWWWVKPLVKNLAGSRGSWMRGGYRDRRFIESVNPGLPDVVAPEAAERDRWAAWLGLRYREAEMLDETPASMHIVEYTDGSVAAYRLYDADASEQGDLFAAGFSADGSDDEVLPEIARDPTRFSGSAWLHRANSYEAEGDLLRAAAALRRAVDRAVNETDRSTAWIRMGELFREHHHTRKAVFCLHNAWERDREEWIQALIAQAYLENDQPGEALPYYEAALATMPGNPEYLAGKERCRSLLAERAIPLAFPAGRLAR